MPEIVANLPSYYPARVFTEIRGVPAALAEAQEGRRDRQATIHDDKDADLRNRRAPAAATDAEQRFNDRATGHTQRAEPLFGRRADDDRRNRGFNPIRNDDVEPEKASLRHQLITTPGLPEIGFLAHFISQATSDDRNSDTVLGNSKAAFREASRRYVVTDRSDRPLPRLAPIDEPV